MANMTFKGVIKHLGPVQEISTQHGETFLKRHLVLEETDVPYPCSLLVELTGENAQSFSGYEGQICEVFLNSRANCSNGRWFNNLTAWKINFLTD